MQPSERATTTDSIQQILLRLSQLRFTGELRYTDASSSSSTFMLTLRMLQELDPLA